MAETDARPTESIKYGYGIEEQVPANNLNEFDFRKILLNLDRNLMQQDIVALKYLCLDRCIGLRHGELEKVERGLDILDRLEKRGLLSKDKLEILVELLGLIDRVDLKLQVERCLSFSQRGKQTKNISSYRRMALDFAYDIGQKELSSLKPLLKSHMSARKIEKLDEPIKLMIELEKLAVISDTNLEFLNQIAEYLENDDLALKIKTFEASSGYQKMSKVSSYETQASSGYRYAEDKFKSLKVDDPAPCKVDISDTQQGSYVSYVAGKLGAEWQMLGYTLGLSSTDMDGLDSPHSMLSKWQQRTTPDAQIETLQKALRTPRVHREDISICLKQGDFSGFASVQPSETAQQSEVEISNSPTIAQVLEPGLQLKKYNMTHFPRGICLIINNMNFTAESKLKERRGSDIDEGNLLSVFSHLGFDVRVTRDATACKMKRLIDGASGMDHSNFDCFVCCILSHGDLGTVSSSDGESCKILDFTNPFRPKYCPSLASKPKLFFLQACQGNRRAEHFDHIESDAATPVTGDNIPDDADFLLGYATAPGNVSFRSKTQGSWYITKLTDTLKKHHNTDHILDILTHVNSEVSKAIARETKNTYKQVPAPQYTLRKNLYFTV